MKKISVLMSTYNEPIDWIEKSINSIVNQTYKKKEIIIVCDNPDNIELQNYLIEKSRDEPSICIIFNKKNIGLAKSLNKALLASSGEYIARMDADDIAFLNRFEYQVSILEESPDLDLLSSNVTTIDEMGQIMKIARGNQYSNNNLRKILEIGNVFVHPTFFARRIVFEKLEGYREFPAAEDYDFVLRALDQNFNLLHTAEPILYYRMRQNSMSLGNALVAQMCVSYIKELHRERVIFGYDSYNLSCLKDRISLDEIEKSNFSHVIYSMKVKHRKTKILIPLDIMKGIIKSTYFRKFFFEMLHVQFARRMYRDKNEYKKSI